EARAGGLLKHLGDSFESVEALKKRAAQFRPGKEPAEQPEKIPADVERRVSLKFLGEHYGKWPDERLPALAGKTPGEAVEPADGRRMVEDLIRTMENGAERDRQAGRAAFDFQPLRKALGL